MGKKNLIRLFIFSAIMGACIRACFIFNLVWVAIGSSVFIMIVSNLWKCTDGILQIDYSDPDKDIYTMEIITPFGEIDKRSDLYFRVNKQ